MPPFWSDDPYLDPYSGVLERRSERIAIRRDEIAGCGKKLYKAINNHLYYILHHDKRCWYFREWAPNASKIYLVGDFNDWKRLPRWELQPIGEGNWELEVPLDAVRHLDHYKWFMEWPGGGGERIPSYAYRCVQDPVTKLFSAQVWSPEKAYRWRNGKGPRIENPLIYEAHIGMSGEEEKVSTFDEFRNNVLPRIVDLGYNTIQIMALQEHPYYGSFGYQVSSFFALSSRFGTPEEFKRLVDEAHGHGIAVIMDIVHSHSVDNEQEGLSRFDGSETLYFHGGAKGRHPAWGSRCFDYGKSETQYFLLSNCKFWMQEYHLDGFRFDGITSMIYWDHGLGRDFTNYGCYFDDGVDEDALTYLGLANILVHEVNPDAFTIAEDMSGMPGLAAPSEKKGIGFSYRMSMGIADHWIKWIKELSDWQWNMGGIYYELTNKRADERTISYAECHDQAMVGDKTIIFRLCDKEMYTAMNKGSDNLTIDRGIALHKMIRLVTLATAGDGYLNFMGNEFGHPEWIDFPREGNGWSYFYARRQWSLSDNPMLRYMPLRDFDKAMVHLFGDNRVLESKPVCLRCDEEKKILIMKRGDFLFVFSFHPTESFEDYGFDAPAGEYGVVLDSDAKEFDGFGRNDDAVVHFTVANGNGNELKLYLPNRTALVFHRKSDGV
ncbi:MAG: alpha amylase C-terminal domain-containing protein [Bacteroidales bacterium]|nr:alpha amylase C-terminal domain-containing protein [Bacteroidales bacterium]